MYKTGPVGPIEGAIQHFNPLKYSTKTFVTYLKKSENWRCRGHICHSHKNQIEARPAWLHAKLRVNSNNAGFFTGINLFYLNSSFL